MNQFIIQTFANTGRAKTKLNRINEHDNLDAKLVYLNCSNEQWQDDASIAIKQADAVIIFNHQSCMSSDNTKWAIAAAQRAGKEIIELTDHKENSPALSKLQGLKSLNK